MCDKLDKDEIIENLKLKILSLEGQLNFFKKKSVVDVGTQYESLTLMDDFNLYKETNNRIDISIADMLKETSETYLLDSGYSYDAKTGLYYHKTSGYYYDPSTLLFYNPNNGVYYSYDSETQEYKYHSKVDVEALTKLSKEMIWKQGYQHKPPQDIINSNSEKKNSELAPCIRIINESSGELEIITCLGGSIGTDANKNHSIFIDTGEVITPEIHLKIEFDVHDSQYLIRSCCDDVRSQLNGTTISQIPHRLLHHSKILINNNSYLAHIHNDYGTCDWCEPGQMKSKLKDQNKSSYTLPEDHSLNVVDIKRERSRSRRVVNQLKVKYGLRSGWREPVTIFSDREKYVDRALIRRNKEKENIKSEETKSIKAKDTALEMMFKMGWSPGKALGKTGTGIREPIDVHYRLNERAGIGSEETVNIKVDSDFKIDRKLANLQMTRKRYNSLFNK